MTAAASIFISHSSCDNAIADDLYQWLKSQGFQGLFLDYHPEDGIPTGSNWESELYRQLKRCGAVLFIGTGKSVESKWCFAELTLARSMGKTIIPLRFEQSAQLALLDDRQWTDFFNDRESGFKRVLAGLEQQGVDPRASFDWDPKRAPYPGLAAFQEADAAVFFGRQQESRLLFERVNNSLLESQERFVSVVGPSGSGKSSLVRAGLMPRLKKAGIPWIVIPPFMPQDRPLEMAARALARAFDDLGEKKSWRSLLKQIDEDGDLVSVGRDLIDLNGVDQAVVVLFIDQGEELVTMSGDEDRDLFTRVINKSLARTSIFRVVIALRSEFITSALQHTELAQLIDEPFLIAPLPRHQLASAVAGPAQLAGVSLDEGLVERIVEDTGGGDALPLMAFTMARLYQRVTTGGRRLITQNDYIEVGGVEGALRQRADAVQRDLIRQHLADLIVPALLKLVTVDQAAEPTRRRVPLASLSEDEQTVMRAFIDARLIVTEGKDEETVVYVAHEALLRVWQPFVDAIDSHIDILRMRSRLERDARDWEAAGKDNVYLLSVPRLEESRIASEYSLEMSPLVEEYVGASESWYQQRRAREADLLANRIIGDYSDDPERAILVTRAAISEYGKRPRLQLALSYAVFAPGLCFHMQTEQQVGAMAISSDGLAIVYSLNDQLIFESLDDGTGWQRQLPPSANPAVNPGFVVATFFANGEFIAISRGGPVLILDPKTGETVDTLDYTQAVTAVCGSARLLIVAESSGSVHFLGVEPGFETLDTYDFDHPVELLSIAENEHRVAAVTGKDATIFDLFFKFLYRGDKPPAIIRRIHHGERINSVEFSPDGKQLASVAWDNAQVSLWDLPRGDASWDGRTDIVTRKYINSVAWSADGTQLITAEGSYGLRFWDAKTGVSMVAPAQRYAKARRFNISANGSRLVASSDESISVWSVQANSPRLSQYMYSAFSRACFADNDRVLLTRASSGGSDTSIHVRDARTGKELHHIRATGGVSRGWCLSDDSRHIAIIESERVVACSLPDMQETMSIPLQECNHVLFESGGHDVLITVNHDGIIQRWSENQATTLFEVGDFYAGSLDLSVDGQYILVAKSGEVRLFDIHRGEQVFEIDIEKKTGDLRARIAPDGSCIAIGMGEQLQTVSMTGKPLVDFAWEQLNSDSSHAAVIGMIEFSPDSRRLATATAEGWVYLWDVNSGELVQLIKADNEPLKDLSFSKNGQELLVCRAVHTGEYDSKGYAEIWACPGIDQLYNLANIRTFREISQEELEQYGLPHKLEVDAKTRSAASLFHLK